MNFEPNYNLLILRSDLNREASSMQSRRPYFGRKPSNESTSSVFSSSYAGQHETMIKRVLSQAIPPPDQENQSIKSSLKSNTPLSTSAVLALTAL